MPLPINSIISKELQTKFVGNLWGMIRAAGKELPTTAYAKLEPIQKFERITGWVFSEHLPIWLRRNKISDTYDLADKMSGGQMQPIIQRLFKSSYPYPNVTNINNAIASFTQAVLEVATGSLSAPLNRVFVQQQSSALTPVNAWRRFLWGNASVLRGRESYERRLLSNILRGAGFASPKEGAWTLWSWTFSAVALWVSVEAIKGWKGNGDPGVIVIEPDGPSGGSTITGGTTSGGGSGGTLVPYGSGHGFGNSLFKPTGHGFGMYGGMRMPYLGQMPRHALVCDVCHRIQLFQSLAFMTYVFTLPFGPHAWCNRCRTWTRHHIRTIG